MQKCTPDKHERYDGSQLLPGEAVIICCKSCAPGLNATNCQQWVNASLLVREKGSYRANLPHGQKVSQTPKRPSIRASLIYGHTKVVKCLTRPGFSVEGTRVDGGEPECVDLRRGCLAGSAEVISLRVEGIGRKGGYASQR
jgi:hypothetical protein